MAIELPDKLVFPGDFGVEVVDPTPMAPRDSCPRDRITVPIDRSTTVQTRAAEQVELPAGYVVSGFDDAGLEVRPTPAQELDNVFALAERGKEARGRARTKPLEDARKPPVVW